MAADREPPRDERRDQPRPPARMSAARLAAWVLLPLALSVGAAGGGLYGGAVIQNQDYRDAEARGAPQEVLDDLVASGRAFEQAAWGLVGLGAALLATSIVLFLAADAEAPVAGASGRSARLAPLLGPGRLGLAFGF